jgi:ABC-type glycerol-3-phosphate transport system substrate-binding protein
MAGMTYLSGRFAIAAFLLVSGLAVAACGSKTAPQSTMTTRTQSKTTTDTGDNSTSDITEKTTNQTDGSQTVKRTETTTKDVPPAPPAPRPN